LRSVASRKRRTHHGIISGAELWNVKRAIGDEPASRRELHLVVVRVTQCSAARSAATFNQSPRRLNIQGHQVLGTYLIKLKDARNPDGRSEQGIETDQETHSFLPFVALVVAPRVAILLPKLWNANMSLKVRVPRHMHPRSLIHLPFLVSASCSPEPSRLCRNAGQRV
jgi:hypothetical protein